MRVGGGDVVSADLGVLIGIAHIAEDRVGAGSCADHVRHVQVVVGVGVLEPGAAVVEVKMNGIGGCEAVIDAIEEILLIALVVEYVELGGIEKAAGVQNVGLDEVAPALSAV